MQLTTDGHKAYLEAVEGAFGGDIDYAMLVKLYGETPEGEKRYSPAECIGTRKTRIEGAAGISPKADAVDREVAKEDENTAEACAHACRQAHRHWSSRRCVAGGYGDCGVCNSIGLVPEAC